MYYEKLQHIQNLHFYRKTFIQNNLKTISVTNAKIVQYSAELQSLNLYTYIFI